MTRRGLAALTTSALVAFAGGAAAQQSGGGAGGSSGGQSGSAGSQSGGSQSGGQRGNQTGGSNQVRPQQDRDPSNAGPATGTRDATGGDGIGTRSQPSGADLGLPSGNQPILPPIDPNANQTGRPRQQINQQQNDFSGLVRDGQLDAEFVRNLNPEQRLNLARQLGLVEDFDDGGSGVRMSQDRALRLENERLNRLRQQQGRTGVFGTGEADGFGGGRNAALELQRLEQLEERIMAQNDWLLRRLGQARQMSGDRQVRAMGEVLQDLILQHGEVMAYMGELRYTVAEQAGLSPQAPVDARIAPRSYAAPERFGWELEDERESSARPYRNAAPPMYDEQGRRWR